MAEINLFGEIKLEEGEEWRAEWKDMPEFVHDDMFPKQRIIMNFKTHADALAFGKLIGQNVTSETDSLWYPKPTYSPLGVYQDDL